MQCSWATCSSYYELYFLSLQWVATPTGNSSCPQSVMVSSATDDWLITQYINSTLSSGTSATEVDVHIQFTCTGNCSSNLDLVYYPTNTEQSPSELTALRDSFVRVNPVLNGRNRVTGFTTTSGFYLAIQATGNISVTINQISIILTVCGERTVNLISFPEAYASSVAGSCSANSMPSGSGAVNGTCGNDGMWTTSSSCVCNAGYFLDNDACTGTDIHIACRCSVYIFIISGWLKCVHYYTSIIPSPNVILFLQVVQLKLINPLLEIRHVLLVHKTVRLYLSVAQSVFVNQTICDPIPMLLLKTAQVIWL